MDQMDVDQRLSSKKRPANQSLLNLPSEKRPKFPFLEDRKADIEEALRSFDAPLKQLVADSDLQHVVATLNFVIKAWEIVDSIPEDAVEIALKSKREEFETVLKRCSESGSWFSGIAYLFSLESNTKTADIAYVPRLETAEGFRIYLLQNSGIHLQSSFLAIVSAWRTEYKGRTADLVEAILLDYMGATNHYARYVAHIQSSGTGKSRTHDELAKRRFYIPICLASPVAHAFPPGDIEVRDWFKNVYWEQETVQRRCNAFLHALMAQAKEALDMIVKDLKKDLDDLADGSIRSARRRLHLLSSTFRQKMSEGGTFGSHGPYRSKFYASVSKRAAELSSPPYILGNDPHNKSVIADAASEVVQLLDPSKYFRAEPVVIICWDESHLLAEQDEGQPWTYFSALRQTLHKIKDMPIFSVFLSTAVKSHLFSPDLQSNPSNRMTTLFLHRFSPITEVGFDEFAIKVKANGESKLGEIASTHHIAHLGRALFATLYDCGDRSIKNSIVNYAQVKLLSSEPSLMRTELRPAEMLACLAIRLGLDFRSASWVEREAERTQVERHMRLCLAATAGFRSMVTISPSEPLLAEAAFDAMTTATYINGDLVATSLLDHIDSSYLDAGNRGEVAASLLLLLARDKAVKAPDRQDILPLGKRSMDPKNDGWTSGRIITALDFLRALLPSDHHRPLGQHKPSRYVEGKDGETLEEAFADGVIWFNHFIKVNDFSMVNRQYLSCLISRGAAIICADNHRGVDLVIPILFNDSLKPESVSAILIQVKNDASFTHNVRTALFDLMDPYEVNLFSKGETPSFPITRLVFALASKRAGVMFPSPGCRSNRYVSNDKYTAYDIWVAGVTPESFGVISQDSVQTYNSLLQRSINAFNGYGLFDHSSKEQVLRDGRTSARRRMHPGVSSILEHQQNYVALDSGQSPCVRLDDNEEE